MQARFSYCTNHKIPINIWTSGSCSVHCVEHIPSVLCSHYSVVLQHSAALLFCNLMTLSNTELEHAQLHQLTIMLKEWVWSINHGHAEQKMHDFKG